MDLEGLFFIGSVILSIVVGYCLLGRFVKERWIGALICFFFISAVLTCFQNGYGLYFSFVFSFLVAGAIFRAQSRLRR